LFIVTCCHKPNETIHVDGTKCVQISAVADVFSHDVYVGGCRVECFEMVGWT